MAKISTKARLPRKILYGLIVSYVSALAIAGMSIQYSNYVNTESNQRWCDLLVLLDDTYSATPSQNETRKRVAAEIHRLRIDFEC
jgi:hypothetical protein